MNYLKDKINIFIYIITFLPLLLICKHVDNDFYFLYNYGDYIINNGFPTTEPFTIHENFDFVMQQWGSSIIFYFIKNHFGNIGLITFVMIITFISTIILQKTLYMINGNKILSCILTLPSTAGILMLFTTRPFIFSYLILNILLYFMVKYTKTKKWTYLLSLPILSILQTNLHASMFIFLLLFIFPFIFELKCFRGKYITYEEYNKKPVIIFFILMIITSVINPYGIKNTIYVLNSISKYDLNITEMTSPALSTMSGQILILLFILFSLLFIYNKNKINIRYLLLLFGCIILTFYAMKCVPYLLLSVCLLLADMLRNVDIEKVLTQIFGYYEFYLPFLTVILCIYCLYTFKDINKDLNTLPPVSDAVEYLTNNCDINDNTILYTSYNDGNYAEYKKLKVYLDARLEVFLKQQNNNKDIIEEYFKLQHGIIYYKDFLNTYDFDYIIVNEQDIMTNYLISDNDYISIYSDDYCDIYVKQR